MKIGSLNFVEKNPRGPIVMELHMFMLVLVPTNPATALIMVFPCWTWQDRAITCVPACCSCCALVARMTTVVCRSCRNALLIFTFKFMSPSFMSTCCWMFYSQTSPTSVTLLPWFHVRNLPPLQVFCALLHWRESGPDASMWLHKPSQAHALSELTDAIHFPSLGQLSAASVNIGKSQPLTRSKALVGEWRVHGPSWVFTHPPCMAQSMPMGWSFWKWLSLVHQVTARLDSLRSIRQPLEIWTDP